MTIPASITAFSGTRRIATGPIERVATSAYALASEEARHPALLAFDDLTGRVVDLDLRGPEEAIRARYASRETTVEPVRGRGRPRLGVVAREVTLLPQHWDWLNTQRGGASAALRRLVEEARRSAGAADEQRLVEERTYRFIVAMAGDLPGFEEAARALFAHDHQAFAERMADWPADVREYALRLLRGGMTR